jgi:endoglucanase
MTAVNRRRLLVLVGVIAALVAAWLVFMFSKGPPGKVSAAKLDPHLWESYRSRFLSDDGRVIDRDNDPKGITHTEGQGYGMLLAEAAGDRDRFNLMWHWTESHLRRPDGLFSWKFAACGAQGDCVADKNDAADGDILIAWALLRAGQDWGRSDYAVTASDIAKAISNKLVVGLGKNTLLLPAVEGFSDKSGVTVNLSYWLFPAFNAFTAAFNDPLWHQLSDSGVALLQQARFGKWQLPPDWLRIEGDAVRPADGFPPRYSYDAVRVPLYLVWGGITDKEVLAPFLSFWSAFHPADVPAWVDLKTDAVAPYAWQAGMAAIAALTQRGAGADASQTAELPLPGPHDGYFSWSLCLLTRVASAERGG